MGNLDLIQDSVLMEARMFTLNQVCNPQGCPALWLKAHSLVLDLLGSNPNTTLYSLVYDFGQVPGSSCLSFLICEVKVITASIL